MLTCKFCCKECKNQNSLSNHQRLCSQNPSRQLSNLEKQLVKPPPWNKGKLLGPRSSETKLKLSKVWLGRTHSKETKEKMSDSRKRLYESGWEPVCGRAKKYKHISPIAGEVLVDGTWELKVAKYLDSIGVNWCRNKKRFLYINLSGNQSTYQPDFYVEDWATYLEVKGYETELDRCKWSQFTEPLLIWRKAEIETLES